jgi:hypothetical protein
MHGTTVKNDEVSSFYIVWNISRLRYIMCRTFRRAWGRFNLFQQLCFWIAVCNHTAVVLFFFLVMAGQPQMGQGLLTIDDVRSHSAYHTQWETSLRMIGPSQRLLPDNTQLSQQTHTHVLGAIRTHNPSQRMAAGSNLRQRRHQHRYCRIIEQTLSKHRCIYVQTPSVLYTIFF